jgi:hypothetical protein
MLVRKRTEKISTTPFLLWHFSPGHKIENCLAQFLAVCWIVHVEFKLHRLRDGFSISNALPLNQSLPAFIGHNLDKIGGKLGAQVSSRRFKQDIKPMDKTSEALLALKPVSFRYNKEIDPAGTSQFGLVAEEVDKVDPDLVIHDKSGKPYSVRYDQVNAMLLNEFLKEHRAFVEEQLKVTQHQKEIDAMKAELEHQRSLIEKVSAKVEVNESGTKVATSNP